MFVPVNFVFVQAVCPAAVSQALCCEQRPIRVAVLRSDIRSATNATSSPQNENARDIALEVEQPNEHSKPGEVETPRSDTSSDNTNNANGDGGGRGRSGRGGGGGGGAGGAGKHDGDSGKPEDGARPSEDVLPMTAERNGSKQQAMLSEMFADAIKTIPVPVYIAIITLFSSITAAQVRWGFGIKQDKLKRIAEARKHKEQIEHDLRERYEALSAPLLRSATELSQHLRFLVEGDWDEMDDVLVSKAADSRSSFPVSPTYSTYLLARLLAHVLLLKTNNDLLDFGFRTADRILRNILSRVQGVLSASDATIAEIQTKEAYFKPPENDRPLAAGPLKMTTRTQAMLGELLLRRRWSKKVDFITDLGKGGDPTTVTTPVLSFLEFSRLLEGSEVMQQYFGPVIAQFTELEAFSRSTPKLANRHTRRDDRIGARLYILQSGLVDMLDFFDPLPDAKSVPMFQRARLALGDAAFNEGQPLPHAMRLVYHELAGFRDKREMKLDTSARLRSPHCVEVFVTGARSNDGRVATTAHCSCTDSHRVVIALREMGIPHKTVPIARDAQPVWFYLLQPDKSMPVIYHNGNVVLDADTIVRYLSERFPKAKPLASTAHLRLDSGTAAFTRFHPQLVRWLRDGGDSARGKMVTELRHLDSVLRHAQERNGGKPFLGGARFSDEDAAIVPCLHEIEVAGRQLKQWELPAEFSGVWKYLNAARNHPSFKYAGAEEDDVVRRFKSFSTGSD